MNVHRMNQNYFMQPFGQHVGFLILELGHLLDGRISYDIRWIQRNEAKQRLTAKRLCLGTFCTVPHFMPQHILYGSTLFAWRDRNSSGWFCEIMFSFSHTLTKLKQAVCKFFFFTYNFFYFFETYSSLYVSIKNIVLNQNPAQQPNIAIKYQMIFIHHLKQFIKRFWIQMFVRKSRFLAKEPCQTSIVKTRIGSK